MSLNLVNPDQTIKDGINFLMSIMQKTGKKNLLVAVSGGIDSALSLSLAVRAAGANNVHALFLPYKDQSTADSAEIARWNNLPAQNIHEVNIGSMVDAAAEKLQAAGDELRLGNIMARMRMIAVYDLAKQLDALVCGTENKSEKYLGYFTRFGDEASDLEPIQHLYKTQVRQLVEHLNMPKVFLEKPPSAGLWQGQTDEQELGFSYEEADKVLAELIDGERLELDPAIKEKVIVRVRSQHFKHEVPYTL
ncbi:MAG: synthase [Patescibacteria group bacterium]|nr:synthase [Patescibacteria group bacterium]